MMKSSRTAIFAALACVRTICAAQWTNPVEVRYDTQRCVSYRAALSGEFLIVQATHEPGWHTYAMDNKKRAEEKLVGKQSLGIDQPTEIKLGQGLEAAGPWYQTPPKDFSKPELNWFSWVFEKQTVFAAKVRRSGTGPARIGIRGQACTESTCKNIDTAISLPLTGAEINAPLDLKSLIQVR